MNEKKTFYDIPTQVRFKERDNDKPLYGIAFGSLVICACCGGVFSLNDEYYELATVEKDLEWIDISEFIGEEPEEDD